MNIKLLLSSKAVSLAGDAIFNIGFPLLLMDKTGRSDIFGFSLALQTLAFMFVTLIGGVVADKTRTLAACVALDFIRGALVLLILLTCEYAFSVPMVVLLLMVLSALTAFYNIVLDGMSMKIVASEELRWLLSRSVLCTQIFEIAGFALGGVLIAILGFRWAFFVNAASFFLAGLLLLPTFRSSALCPLPSNASETSHGKRNFRAGLTTFANQLKLGFQISWKDRTIRYILGLALCLNSLAAARETLWFPVLRQIHHLNEAQIGTWSSAVAGCIALSSFVVQKLSQKGKHLIPLTLLAQLFVIFSGLIAALSSSLLGLVLSSIILGIGGLLHGIPSSLIRKERIPLSMQGSALATARVLSRVVVPSSMFAVAYLQTQFDTQHIFLTVTLLAAGFSLLPFFKLLQQHQGQPYVLSDQC